MPDYVHADITIGGLLTIHQIGVIAKKLFEIDRHNQVTYTFGGLLQQINETGEIFYKDEQAEWGEFSELEQYLREQGIWYDRDTDGSGDIESHITYFRGKDATESPFVEYYNYSGDVMVPIDTLVDIRKKVVELTPQGIAEMKKATEFMNNNSPTPTNISKVANDLLDILKKACDVIDVIHLDTDEALKAHDVEELPDVTIINPVKNKVLTQTELEQLRLEGL